MHQKNDADRSNHTTTDSEAQELLRTKDLNLIPPVMRERDQWLLARLSPSRERDKQPIAPDKGRGWNDGSELLEFDEALQQVNVACKSDLIRLREGEEIVLGYRFNEDDPLAGIDIDNVENPANVEPLLDELTGSYVERSVSGEGLHIITRGSLKQNLTKTPLSVAGDAFIEAYDHNRYFTVTGDVVGGRDQISRQKEALDSVIGRFTATDEPLVVDDSGEEEDNSQPALTELGRQGYESHTQSTRLQTESPTVEQVVRTAREMDPEFDRLWRGDTAGWPSQSEADLSLACKLSFYCQGDRQLMDRCFRESDCYGSRSDRSTPKWDEVRSAAGETYGELTLTEAVRRNQEDYNGHFLD